jgi:hypothetical protein
VGVNRHHVGTVQSRRSMRFTTEPLLEHRVSGNLGRQNFDCDDPVDDGVDRPSCSTFSGLSSLHGNYRGSRIHATNAGHATTGTGSGRTPCRRSPDRRILDADD